MEWSISQKRGYDKVEAILRTILQLFGVYESYREHVLELKVPEGLVAILDMFEVEQKYRKSSTDFGFSWTATGMVIRKLLKDNPNTAEEVQQLARTFREALVLQQIPHRCIPPSQACWFNREYPGCQDSSTQFTYPEPDHLDE
jgi:hypothetical protein